MIATPVSCDHHLGLRRKNSSYRLERGGNVPALTLRAHGTPQSLATLSSLRAARGCLGDPSRTCVQERCRLCHPDATTGRVLGV
jgi:hypothetical protein